VINLAIPVSAAILFILGGTLIAVSGIISYVMIGEVNRKLPEDQKIGYILFYPAKAFRIAREYNRLYPNSHLNTIRIVLNVVGGILIIACAAQISHFGR
jgi:hypothetical protein